MMPADYTPKDDLDYTLRYWWVLVVLMLVGTAVGWGVSRLLPPLYEAQAEITISIDISRTGTLTGENQDMLIDSAGDVIGSPVVMDSLHSDFPESQDYRTFLERKADRFALRIQSHDPQMAVDVARRWQDLAMNELDQAASHVIAAEILERTIDGLSNCVSQIPSAGGAQGGRSQPGVEDIQAPIQQLGKQLQQEIALSMGLIPGIRYWTSKNPQIPSEPVQYDHKFLLLGGGLIGFVAGLWLLHLRIPGRIRIRRQRG